MNATFRKYMPVLDIFISMPLIRMQIGIISQNPTRFEPYVQFTYLGYQWEFWKWNGFIKINKLNERMLPHLVPNDNTIKSSSCGCFESEQHRFKKFCDEHYKKRFLWGK